MRSYLARVMKYHDNPRTRIDFIQNIKSPDTRDHLIRKWDLGNSTAAQREAKQHQIHYAEQEFSSMDWECSKVDPRWNHTLSVIVLRHPVERHLSEFFYSGPGHRQQLNTHELFGKDARPRYKNGLIKMITKELPIWLDDTRIKKRSMVWFFYRQYTDNFQLRALAGCAHGSCLASKNLTLGEKVTIDKGVATYLNKTYTNPDGACTTYFSEKLNLLKPCRLKGVSDKVKDPSLCPNGCDVPCDYPVSAWGPLDQKDLSHAIGALNQYDAVFITETLDNDDQAAFLADVMGVPPNATFSLRNKNTNTEKTSERERTHFYRDLLLNLTLNELYDRIHQENTLEIKLFDYAVKLNSEMVAQWKDESGWTA